VLCDPKLVETIQTSFIPVAIYNNRGGIDSKILNQFFEPSWNNPVVRFIDHNAKDLIPRKDGIYSISEIAKRMITALKVSKNIVPEKLLEVIQ